MMFVMWLLNVDSDCSMLCSSPMSAWTEAKTGRRLPASAGTGSPACAIALSSPTVFSATVLPPVFGPVISSTEYVPPTESEIGTASTGSSGWRAFTTCRTSGARTSHGCDSPS